MAIYINDADDQSDVLKLDLLWAEYVVKMTKRDMLTEFP